VRDSGLFDHLDRRPALVMPCYFVAEIISRPGSSIPSITAGARTATDPGLSSHSRGIPLPRRVSLWRGDAPGRDHPAAEPRSGERTMRKIKLDVDDLQVLSFEANEPREERGTVRGHVLTEDYNTCQGPTCDPGNTCWDSCGADCTYYCATDGSCWNFSCVWTCRVGC
jgi:hypothetical protein